MATTNDKSNADRAVSSRDVKDRDTNPDPITGAPGSHPAGTAAGSAAGGLAGAAAGAAIGSVVPGIGTVIGGVVGTVVGATGGGLAGKAVAEKIDPTVEDAYWRENYSTQPYYNNAEGYSYDADYAPAYRYGWESKSQHADRRYDRAESDLASGWDRAKGKSRLSWDKAKHATRSAWDRAERAMPGDSDRDGK